MSEIDNELWSALALAKLKKGDLAARTAAPHLTARLLAAIGYNGRRHFLIPLSDDDSSYTDNASRGLTVETRDLDTGNLPGGRYLDLECSDPSGHEAFDLIGNNIAQLLHDAELSPAEVVAEVLARWRRFWGQIPRSTLSDEALLGLFGEMWFLTYWLIPAQGPDVLKAWKGPAGARHDFQLTGASVEIKTTASVRGRIHRIHGVDQLSPPENGSLYLFSLRLRSEPGATNSLPQIIEACARQLTGNAAMLDLLEQNLILAGYSPVHIEHYREHRFQIVEEALFDVRDDFPSITPTHLSSQVSGGVEAIEYVINLNAYDHLCVARIPEELNSLGWQNDDA